MSSRVGRPRRRVIAEVRATEPNCHLCGYPIDLALDYQRHALASTVDELVPVADGGSTTDRANCRHAHRCCNSSRNKHPITDEVRRRCRTLAEEHLAASGPSLVRTW